MYVVGCLCKYITEETLLLLLLLLLLVVVVVVVASPIETSSIGILTL